MRSPIDALDAACGVLGGQQQLADAITTATPETPCTTSAISQWRTRLRDGSPFPEDRCEPIEAVTVGAVVCEELRPDLIWRRGLDGRVVGIERRILPTPRPLPLAAE